jgi:hypothetical protein
MGAGSQWGLLLISFNLQQSLDYIYDGRRGCFCMYFLGFKEADSLHLSDQYNVASIESICQENVAKYTQPLFLKNNQQL